MNINKIIKLFDELKNSETDKKYYCHEIVRELSDGFFKTSDEFEKIDMNHHYTGFITSSRFITNEFKTPEELWAILCELFDNLKSEVVRIKTEENIMRKNGEKVTKEEETFIYNNLKDELGKMIRAISEIYPNEEYEQIKEARDNIKKDFDKFIRDNKNNFNSDFEFSMYHTVRDYFEEYTVFNISFNTLKSKYCDCFTIAETSAAAFNFRLCRTYKTKIKYELMEQAARCVDVNNCEKFTQEDEDIIDEYADNIMHDINILREGLYEIIKKERQKKKNKNIYIFI